MCPEAKIKKDYKSLPPSRTSLFNGDHARLHSVCVEVSEDQRHRASERDYHQGSFAIHLYSVSKGEQVFKRQEIKKISELEIQC